MPKLFCVCLSTLRTTPIADIKTKSEVEPALINGNGKPVGGILPDTTAMFKITCMLMIAPIPKHKNAENLLSADKPTHGKTHLMKVTNLFSRCMQ